MKTVAIMAGMCLVFLFVWERVDVVRLGYHVEQLKAHKLILERERAQLQVKFSALTAPERIAKVATTKLGLVPPQQDQVFMVQLPRDRQAPANPSAEEIRVARNIANGGMKE